ncbi:alkylhydroperoxidase [Haloferax mucosum ATCC BAA-1512]|uniref:Alkylhydroperoxidase n=1 Tax=Haloferax mucosum ATCC BAA-1512 TaxID=662479 RepID=M0I719_9EURY|nr:hypothetical protein [Haloferax mucosum]ELZ91244.1 alkylhydroperoxidase [Haloferax mucosum ATCC BAA-1512]
MRGSGEDGHESDSRKHTTIFVGTDEELSEIAFLASWTARYSAIIHGMDYDMDTFEDEFGRMAAHLEEQMADDD